LNEPSPVVAAESSQLTPQSTRSSVSSEERLQIIEYYNRKK